MMNGKSNKQPDSSRIPVMSPSPLRRSGSLRLNICPPIQERSDSDHKISGFRLNRQRSLQSLNTAGTYACERDDDMDSVKSYTSTGSVCSNVSQCEHANFARNGTTYSGRCKRYVVHCSPHSTATDEYLTPTQRTNRTIRHLRNLLKDAQEEIMEKEKEIMRLTKEVVKLRLLKADPDSGTKSDEFEPEKSQTEARPEDISQCSPRTRSCGSPGVAVPYSLSDSGHFEDLGAHSTPVHKRQQLEDEIREIKERHNERVDSLLQRITDVNDRYYALRPMYEDCKEQLREALKLNEELKNNIPQSQLLTIVELQNSNKELKLNHEELVNKLNRLEQVNRELESIKLSHDKLTKENSELKDKEDELTNLLEQMKEQDFITSEVLTKAIEELELLRNNTDKLVEENTLLKSREEELVRVCVDRMRLETYEKDNQTDFFDHLSTETQTEATAEEVDQNLYDSLDSVRLEIGLKVKDDDKGSLRPAEAMRSESLPKTEAVQSESLHKTEAAQSESLPTTQVTGNGQVKLDESSVLPDLLQKLQVTQEELENIKINYRRLLETKREAPKHDAEMTLQFLKSAFYYFLTDRENSQGHLTAIESILGFNDAEKNDIDKAYLYR